MIRILFLSLIATVITLSTWSQTYFGELQYIIHTECNQLKSIYCIDLDGDGDNDVLTASDYDNKIAWYENNGDGIFGDQQVISVSVSDARSLFSTDLDGDGDNDVLFASYYDDRIAWFENDGAGNFGDQQVLSDSADGEISFSLLL